MASCFTDPRNRMPWICMLRIIICVCIDNLSTPQSNSVIGMNVSLKATLVMPIYLIQRKMKLTHWILSNSKSKILQNLKFPSFSFQEGKELCSGCFETQESFIKGFVLQLTHASEVKQLARYLLLVLGIGKIPQYNTYRDTMLRIQYLNVT